MSVAYRLMLRLLPTRVRERHGSEMLEMYELMLERAGPGARARLVVLMKASADVIRRAPVEHGRRRYVAPERKETWMSGFVTEVRQALRGTLRQPGLTMLVILMLGLGMAASTTVFTLIDGLFLRPLPFEDADRLVYINTRAPNWNLEYVGINYPDFVQWQKDGRAFESMAMFDDAERNVAMGDTPERVHAMTVSKDYGTVMKVKPLLGRWFSAEEDRPKAARVVVISDDMWRSHFNSSRDVIGRTIRIDEEAYTVVGVAPARAAFPLAASLWVPYRGDPNQPYQSYNGNVVARMKPGATVQSALADLLRANAPVYVKNGDTEHNVIPRLEPLRDRYVGQLSTLSRVMFGGVIIVLLVACANVMSMMLARTASRRRELAVRMALGAGAGRLTMQLLAETLVLSLIGAVAGLLLAGFATKLLLRSVPEGLPVWLNFGLDVRVLAFVFGVSVIASLIAGLGPVVQAARSRAGAALTAEAGRRTTATPAQRRMLNILVTGEIALACVLLVCGGLLLKTYQRVNRIDPGFRPDHAFEFRIDLPEAKYPFGKPEVQFYNELLGKLRAMPDVEAVGAVQCPPLTCHWGMFYRAEGAPPPPKDAPDPVVLTRLATPGYDRAIGLKLLQGRFFNEHDGQDTGSMAVVINEMLAKQLWPGVNPIGKRLHNRSDDNKEPYSTVIGVVQNERHYGLDKDPRPGLYVPFAQRQNSSMSFILRTRGDPSQVMPGVHTVVHGMDAGLPLYDVKTLDNAVRESLTLRRTYSWMLAVFACIAMVLAVGGIYGVLSYVVSQRTQEIGIRMALGAQRGQVMRLVLRHGALLAVIGTTIGLFASFGTGRLLNDLLVGGSSRDTAIYVAVSGLLTATALLAAFVPARRAISVEPQKVLRDG